jgi:hypothetical protein
MSRELVLYWRVLSFAIVFTLLFSDPSAWAGHWIVQRVDPASDVGLYISMKTNRTAVPLAHISYYDHAQKRLKYAKQRSGTPGWDIDVVDAGDVGEYSSLALDSNNLPHITYYDAGTRSLKYARQTAFGTWVRTVVDSGGVGKHTSIALDSENVAHISYYDHQHKHLKYTRGFCRIGAPLEESPPSAQPILSCNWKIEVVDDGGRFLHEPVAGPTSIALDSFGRPHIGYSKAQGVAYARKRLSDDDVDIGGWIIDHSIFNYGEAADVSLAIDSDNLPHMVIRATSSDACFSGCHVAHAWKLRLRGKWEDAHWIVESTPSAGRGTSIALFGGTLPLISFPQRVGGPRVCGRETMGSVPKLETPEWSCWTVDMTVNVLGSFSVIVLDDLKTNPRIAYYDEDLRALKFAHQGVHDGDE